MHSLSVCIYIQSNRIVKCIQDELYELQFPPFSTYTHGDVSSYKLYAKCFSICINNSHCNLSHHMVCLTMGWRPHKRKLHIYFHSVCDLCTCNVQRKKKENEWKKWKHDASLYRVSVRFCKLRVCEEQNANSYFIWCETKTFKRSNFKATLQQKSQKLLGILMYNIAVHANSTNMTSIHIYSIHRRIRSAQNAV